MQFAFVAPTSLDYGTGSGSDRVYGLNTPVRKLFALRELAIIYIDPVATALGSVFD